MTTTVTVTGTGTPMMVPGLAGPGVLVESQGAALQFDVGRGTTMRLTDAGLPLESLSALFITHHHSDHLVGLADLLMSRWLEDGKTQLPVIVPEGPASTIVERVLDVWRDEIAMRQRHTNRVGDPRADLRAFSASGELTEVLRLGDVKVEAALVEHDPVVPAVGYRVTTPAGVVAISGDTAVGEPLAGLATNADVFVCEAFRSKADLGFLSDPVALTKYHADTTAVGALAHEAQVKTLILTHLIPPVTDESVRRAFQDDVRAGGFTGEVIVASDLDAVTIA